MKIKTIFKINMVIIALQVLPLIISLFSPEFKIMLMTDAFGEGPSKDAVVMFEQFALEDLLLLV